MITDNIKLRKISMLLRKDIINISFDAKAHHIGSELGCIDILTVLYFGVMNIDPLNHKDPSRDWFMMSKGHASLALYVTLSKKGFFQKKIISQEFLTNGGKLGGHPDFNSLPGIEASSGSLGHGLSIGAGVALARKKDNIGGKIYILLGDGECNEGMVWEAAMFAAHNKLNNLIAIVDFNNLQGLGKTEEVLKLGSLVKKFESFGWNAVEIDGHNFDQMIDVFKFKDKKTNKPLAVITNTIKGKGSKSMEGKLKSHYEVINNKKRRNEILKELND